MHTAEKTYTLKTVIANYRGIVSLSNIRLKDLGIGSGARWCRGENMKSKIKLPRDLDECPFKFSKSVLCICWAHVRGD